MKNGIVYLLFLLATILGVSCSEKIIEDTPFLKTLSCVRVVYAVDGLGDRSYTDGIYNGVCNSLNTLSEFAVENYNPKSLKYAEEAIKDWFNPSDTLHFKNRLLILADGGYIDILTAHPEWVIPEGDAILLLDHKGDLPEAWKSIYTRLVSSYGAAYEAALVIRHMGGTKSAIVCANPLLKSLHEFRDGFIDGFHAAGGVLDTQNDVYYLGSGIDDGFYASEALYQKCYEFDKQKGYEFILPVCGGSIQGILRYTRENPKCFYTCGVDVDMQRYSSNVAFSIIKRMDLLVFDFLHDWLENRDVERNVVYGISSKYSGLVVSDKSLGYYPSINDVIRSMNDEALTAENKYLNR